MPLYQYRKGEHERTLMFIHVPKTGGTAIETFFRGIGFTGYFDPPPAKGADAAICRRRSSSTIR